MKTPRYVPDAGDVVWCNFDPQSGHEQAGRRPALVLSPASYNGLVGLFICCPITTKIKGYAFEVRLAGEPRVSFLLIKSKARTGGRERQRARGGSAPPS